MFAHSVLHDGNEIGCRCCGTDTVSLLNILHPHLSTPLHIPIVQGHSDFLGLAMMTHPTQWMDVDARMSTHRVATRTRHHMDCLVPYLVSLNLFKEFKWSRRFTRMELEIPQTLINCGAIFENVSLPVCVCVCVCVCGWVGVCVLLFFATFVSLSHSSLVGRLCGHHECSDRMFELCRCNSWKLSFSDISIRKRTSHQM